MLLNQSIIMNSLIERFISKHYQRCNKEILENLMQRNIELE